MKLGLATLLSTAAILQVMAGCVEVHTDLTYDVFEGDIMSIQVYDDGTEVCHGNVRHDLANHDTVFCIDEKDSECKPGYKICMTQEGKAGTFDYKTIVNEGGNQIEKNVHMSVKLTDMDLYKQGGYDCQCKGEPESCRKCREIEVCTGGGAYVFKNGKVPNCSTPTCKLCDFRGFC